MLYCKINEQGHYSDVRDAISGKMNTFHMFSYKHFVFWCLNLRNDNTPMDLCYRCYK